MLFSRQNAAQTGKKRIYLLLVELVLALALMLFLIRLATNWGGGRAGSMPHDPLAYTNDEHAFSVRVPDASWKIMPNRAPDSSHSVAVLGNTIVRLESRVGDTSNVYAEIGVFSSNPPRAARTLAATALQRIRDRFHSEQDSVSVIAPVTPVTSKIMDGAFFVVEVPPDAVLEPPGFTVWVCTYVTRRERAYTIICKTRSDDYNRLRKDVEFVLQEFRLL